MGEKPTETPTMPLAPVVPAPSAPSPMEQLVDRWFFDWWHNVPGLDVTTFNRCTAARDDLKKRLTAQIEEK